MKTQFQHGQRHTFDDTVSPILVDNFNHTNTQFSTETGETIQIASHRDDFTNSSFTKFFQNNNYRLNSQYHYTEDILQQIFAENHLNMFDTNNILINQPTDPFSNNFEHFTRMNNNQENA
ncbi:hypothetical protein COBT_003750, partial [Conglomerata obtusa]